MPTSAPSTPKLDSIVALGHSGTTGYASNPSDPQGDVRENSWATGANPQVNSVYRRLLATHSALKGHSTSLGVDGSDVDNLSDQVDQMLALTPLPDVVIIQSIDNDMQCDGTDPANEKTFATKLDQVLTTINQKDQNAQIFFVTPLGSVQTYTDATKDLPAAVAGSSGTGPCDTFTLAGKERPAGIASVQKIIDDYFAAIKRVCAAHRACVPMTAPYCGCRSARVTSPRTPITSPSRGWPSWRSTPGTRSPLRSRTGPDARVPPGGSRGVRRRTVRRAAS